MVECSFCGKTVKLGQGKIYAKKDGTSYNFCANKCETNLIELKRKPVKTKWTNAHHKLKSTLHTAKETKKTESTKELSEKKSKKNGEAKK
ncbi:MAG: hypothetical protein HN878_02455 [Candidatus Diapherotrites archaeon]|nr:hypothetical protein [Candidatus Diapherotrites archaeon]